MECSNALLHAKTKGCIAGFSGSIGFTTDDGYAKIKAAPTCCARCCLKNIRRQRRMEKL